MSVIVEQYDPVRRESLNLCQPRPGVEQIKELSYSSDPRRRVILGPQSHIPVLLNYPIKRLPQKGNVFVGENDIKLG